MVYKYTQPRRPISAMFSSPGPMYQLPRTLGHQTHDPRSTYRKQPAYSFGRRLVQVDKSCSPGPVALIDKVFRNGKEAPQSCTLRGRRVDWVHSLTPSPVHYRTESADRYIYGRLPAYTFGAKIRHQRSDSVPGANVYTLPCLLGCGTVDSRKVAAPHFSLRGRTQIGGFAVDLTKAPSPCQYNVGNVDKYKKQAPSFSLSGRRKAPLKNAAEDKSYVVISTQHRRCLEGPNKRTPESPMFSFGIRHSPYLTPVVVGSE